MHIFRLRVGKDMIDDESDRLREQGGSTRCLDEHAGGNALWPTKHPTEAPHQGFVV